jgi:hypothetical protein
MTKYRLALIVAVLAAAPAFVFARGGYRAPRLPSSRSPKSTFRTYRPPKASTPRCRFCARDASGRIKRSSKATSAFQHSNPCPSTGKRSGACPGYVIDHVTPLKRGGADHPANMQWQDEAAARAKDRAE